MSQTRYLLTYDICDEGRLRRVHKVALAFGYPLQYSVFICDLTKQDFWRLRAALEVEMHTGVDSVSIFDLGPSDGRGVECVEHLGPTRTIPTPHHAEIW